MRLAFFRALNLALLAGSMTIDLKEKIFRRHAYWIKIELAEQVGLDALEIENDIQHAPRTLPWLGKNTPSA
jgi:hypothetical protein